MFGSCEKNFLGKIAYCYYLNCFRKNSGKEHNKFLN